MPDSPKASPLTSAYWPWRLALASYACLVLTLVLSVATHGASYALSWHAFLSLLFSAACLLGLTLLSTAAAAALLACIRRPNIVDAVVLLVTLPPLALHVWAAL